MFAVWAGILAATEDMVKGKCSSKKVTADFKCGSTKHMDTKFSTHSAIGYLTTEYSLSTTLGHLVVNFFCFLMSSNAI